MESGGVSCVTTNPCSAPMRFLSFPFSSGDENDYREYLKRNNIIQFKKHSRTKKRWGKYKKRRSRGNEEDEDEDEDEDDEEEDEDGEQSNVQKLTDANWQSATAKERALFLAQRRSEQGTVTIYGGTEDGKVVVVELVGVETQLMVCLPPLHQEKGLASSPEEGEKAALEPWIGREEAVLAAILEHMTGGENVKNFIDNPKEFVNVELVAERFLFGFCGHDRMAFLRLRSSYHWIINKIKNVVSTTSIKMPHEALPFPVALQLGDEQFNPVQRVMTDNYGPPACWYTLPETPEECGGMLLTRDVWPYKEYRADFHYRFYMGAKTSVPILTRVPEIEIPETFVAPFPVVSFDIEITGSPHDEIDKDGSRKDTFITSIATSTILGAGSSGASDGYVDNRVQMLLCPDEWDEPKWVKDLQKMKQEERPTWFSELVEAHDGIMPTRANAPPRSSLPTRLDADVRPEEAKVDAGKPIGVGIDVTYYYGDQKKMLEDWLDYLVETRALVHTGYNHTYFDWPVIMGLCKRYGLMEKLLSIGICTWKQGKVEKSDKQSNAKMAVNRTFPNLPGILQIDAIDQAKDWKSQNYELKTTAAQHLGFTKVENDYNQQFYLWWVQHHEGELRYVMRDALLPQEMLSCRCWDTISAFVQRSAVVMAAPEVFVNSMQQAMVYSMLSARGAEMGICMGTRDFQGFRSLEYARHQSQKATDTYTIIDQKRMTEDDDVYTALAPDTASPLVLCNANRAKRRALEKIMRDNKTGNLKQIILNPYNKPAWEVERHVAFPPDNPTLCGGLVQEPMIGALFLLGVFDFQSLYPSEMEKNNICWTCIVVDDRYANYPGFAFTTVEFEDGGVQYSYRYAIVPDALVIKLIAELKHLRGEYKKKMNEYNALANAALPDNVPLYKKYKSLSKLYNMRQNQTKLVLNSVYGFSAAPRGRGMCPCWPIAASTTAMGRKDITIVKEKLFTKFGLRTAYGDTDSCMAFSDDFVRRFLGCTSDDDKNVVFLEFAALIVRAAKEIGLELNLILTPENIYVIFISLSAKRYLRVPVAVNAKCIPTNMYELVDGKGTKTVRGDSTVWARKTLKQCYLSSVRDRTIYAILHTYGKAVLTLMEGEINVNDCAFEKTLKHYLPYMIKPGMIVPKSNQYIDPELLPHTAAAMREAKRRPNTAPVLGSKVRYVIRFDPAVKLKEAKLASLAITTTEYHETDVEIFMARIVSEPIVELTSLLVALDPSKEDKSKASVKAKLEKYWKTYLKTAFMKFVHQFQMKEIPPALREHLREMTLAKARLQDLKEVVATLRGLPLDADPLVAENQRHTIANFEQTCDVMTKNMEQMRNENTDRIFHLSPTRIMSGSKTTFYKSNDKQIVTSVPKEGPAPYAEKRKECVMKMIPKARTAVGAEEEKGGGKKFNVQEVLDVKKKVKHVKGRKKIDHDFRRSAPTVVEKTKKGSSAGEMGMRGLSQMFGARMKK